MSWSRWALDIFSYRKPTISKLKAKLIYKVKSNNSRVSLNCKKLKWIRLRRNRLKIWVFKRYRIIMLDLGSIERRVPIVCLLVPVQRSKASDHHHLKISRVAWTVRWETMLPWTVEWWVADHKTEPKVRFQRDHRRKTLVSWVQSNIET
jgi:hypothetical protein